MNILVIVLLSTLLILILESNIKTNFIKYKEDNYITVKVTILYGMLRYIRKVPLIDLPAIYSDIVGLEIDDEQDISNQYVVRSEPIANTHKLNQIIDKYTKIYFKYENIIDYIKGKININSILFHTEIGTSDAAKTAIITGLIWSIKSSIISFVTKDCDLSRLSINVIPNYNNVIFKTTIDCIFNIKLGHIIVIRTKVLLTQIKEGVKYEWSSNRIINEDYNGKH